MSTDHIDRPFDDISPIRSETTTQADAAWLREHQSEVVGFLARRSGFSPTAPRKSRRQALIGARRTFRQMLRAAVRRERGGDGG